jgi:hypothetical protein
MFEQIIYCIQSGHTIAEMSERSKISIRRALQLEIRLNEEEYMACKEGYYCRYVWTKYNLHTRRITIRDTPERNSLLYTIGLQLVIRLSEIYIVDNRTTIGDTSERNILLHAIGLQLVIRLSEIYIVDNRTTINWCYVLAKYIL